MKKIRINQAILSKIDFRQPWAWLSTWFGCGLMLPGPGTWGTLGGLPFMTILLLTGGWRAVLFGTLAVSAVGWWAAAKFETASGEHDASAIVIDEVAGIGVTLLAAAPSGVSVGLSFLLFRFFDILKSWPISWADKKLPGAMGVMADDLIAGALAAICLWGLRHVGIG